MRQTIIENTETGLYGYEQYVNRETWVTIFTLTVNKVIFFSTLCSWEIQSIKNISYFVYTTTGEISAIWLA